MQPPGFPPGNIIAIHAQRWNDAYNQHHIDIDGYVTWSTVKNPLTMAPSLIGQHIEEVLFRGDAVGYLSALNSCAMCGGFRWYKYTVMDQPFLALAEFFVAEEIYVVHEVVMASGSHREIKHLKRMLWAASGQYYKHFKGNGTE